MVADNQNAMKQGMQGIKSLPLLENRLGGGGGRFRHAALCGVTRSDITPFESVGGGGTRWRDAVPLVFGHGKAQVITVLTLRCLVRTIPTIFSETTFRQRCTQQFELCDSFTHSGGLVETDTGSQKCLGWGGERMKLAS